ncbi:TPA: phage tail protein [Vibrio harveyi]|nr:phage tail protein [Vibrio harveyi]
MSDNLQNRDVRCYLTNAGRAAELKAIENNKAITITHMIIDADVLPDSADPKAVTQIANPAHSPIPAWVNAKVADGELNVISDIPADVGGFHINGIGYGLADGTIYAYARGMGDYKRQATDGQNDVLRIECEIKTQNSAHITHTYDASKLYVNHFEFNEYKIAHIQAADPHTQYQRKDHAATESEIDSKTSSTLKHITLSMLWRALNNAFTGRRINTTGPLKGGRNLAGDVTLSVDRATTNQLGVTQLTDADGSSSNLAASQKLVNWLKTTLTSLINTKHSEAKAYTDTKHGQAINHANVKKGEAITESKNYADSTKFAKSGGDLSGDIHIKKDSETSAEIKLSETHGGAGAAFKYDAVGNQAEFYTWNASAKEWFLRVARATRNALFAGEIYANSNKRVYHDDYHPSADNADKLNGKTASGIIGESKGYTDQKHNEQQQFFDKKISDIYGGVTPENLNSFLELGKEIQENDSAIMGINRELAKKLSKDQTDAYYQPKNDKLGRFVAGLWDTNGGQDLFCRGKRALVGLSSASAGGLVINHSNDFGKVTIHGVVNVLNELRLDDYLTRTDHSKGFLVGSYNSVGMNQGKTNPIYTIGSNYLPTNTDLGNMYGLGYSTLEDAPFLTEARNSLKIGWGTYFAAAGRATAFINASHGRMWVQDSFYEGGLRLDQKYLLKDETAKNSEKISNVSINRLMRQAKQLDENDDSSSIRTLGVYDVANGTEGVTGGAYGYGCLVHFQGADNRSRAFFQLYGSHYGDLMVRSGFGNDVKDFFRIYTSRDKPTAREVGAVPASDMEHVGKCATANGSNEAAAGSDGYRMAMWQDVQDTFSLFSINSNKTTLTVKHDGYYKIIMSVPRRRHASGSSDQFGKLLINGVQHTKVRADSNNYDAPEIKVYAYVLLRKGNTIQYSTIGSTLATGGGFMIEYARKA